jgi:hypothetical protein
MKTRKLAVLPIFSLLVLNLAHSKPKKPDVPAVFQNAHYVYVEAEGGGILDPTLVLEDRQAISDVEDRVRQWHRYAITRNRREADLVFVVRKGRLATGQPQGGISAGPSPQQGQVGPRSTSGPGQTPGTEIGALTEMGPPDDMLRVYIQSEGRLSSKVWERSLDGGLDAPTLRLVQQLQDAVERAYPQTPPPTTNKP